MLISNAQSPLIEPIDDAESIARFLTDEDQYRIEPPRVHHSAFKLPRASNSLSAYRTRDLQDLEIWEIARTFVTEKRPDKRKVLARAELSAGILTDSKLRLNADGNPHPRHVNIEDWPVACEDMLALRQKLANAAKLIVK